MSIPGESYLKKCVVRKKIDIYASINMDCIRRATERNSNSLSVNVIDDTIEND
jgi:hypothetical protein